MNSIYNWLQFIHVTAAIVWLGGFVASTVLNSRLAVRLDRAATLVLAKQSRFLGTRILGPAAIVTLLAGVGMVAVADLGAPLWVIWGMIVLVSSLLLSGSLLRRFTVRLEEQAASPESDAVAISRLRSRLRAVNSVNLLLLLSAVWAMVAKPV